MSFAIIKVMRVGTQSDLIGLTAHGRREDRSRHVDRSRSHLNCHWSPSELKLVDPSDLCAAVDAVIAMAGAKTHKGSAVAADFHLGASPEFFERDDGTLDLQRAMAWFRTNCRAMLDRFPGMVASMRLDLDESSPHIAAYVVPICTKVTKHISAPVVSFRKVLGGETKDAASRKMVELQDWYAEAMEPLGLQRGIPKLLTGRVGLSHQQYRRLKEIEDAKRLEAVAKAEATIREVETKLQMLDRQLDALKRERARVAQFAGYMQDIAELQDMLAARTMTNEPEVVDETLTDGSLEVGFHM